jgi:hypothetical protein
MVTGTTPSYVCESPGMGTIVSPNPNAPSRNVDQSKSGESWSVMVTRCAGAVA